MGARIERAVTVLTREWIEASAPAVAGAAASSGAPPVEAVVENPLAYAPPPASRQERDDATVVRAMSELKQISAILLGRLDLADCVWQEDIDEARLLADL